jgi:hypothetical protein
MTVDDRDWRGDRHLFGARDATSVVLYSIDAGGALWAHRQNAPGGGFAPAVRVGAAIDWSRFASVFVAKPGYLHAVERRGPIRSFRHLNWSTGGTDVAEEQPLSNVASMSMTAVRWGAFGETVIGGVHVRLWRDPRYPQFSDTDVSGYESGELPADVTGVVGYEPRLYGVDAVGDLVRLSQAPPQFPGGTFKACNPNPWYVAARSSGGYAHVVSPNGRGSSATTAEMAPRPGPDMCSAQPPLEWQ